MVVLRAAESLKDAVFIRAWEEWEKKVRPEILQHNPQLLPTVSTIIEKIREFIKKESLPEKRLKDKERSVINLHELLAKNSIERVRAAMEVEELLEKIIKKPREFGAEFDIASIYDPLIKSTAEELQDIMKRIREDELQFAAENYSKEKVLKEYGWKLHYDKGWLIVVLPLIAMFVLPRVLRG